MRGLKGSFQDLTNQKFGRLIAQWPIGRDKHKHLYWLCLCDCGQLSKTMSSNLLDGTAKSCGCLCLEKFKQRSSNNKYGLKHGKSQSVEGYMLYHARSRAKKLGIPCTITVDDLVIPDKCSLLEIPIYRSAGQGYHPNSPTLDKIIPELGYVKGNCQIISARANLIKNDATLEEFECIARNWRKQCL